MRLDKFIKIKEKTKKATIDWKQFKKKLDEIEILREKTFRVVKDIELMAEDNEGDVYPEVFRKGDIIAGERFSERFLKLLVENEIIEEVKINDDRRTWGNKVQERKNRN